MFGDIVCFFGYFDKLGFGFKDILYLGKTVTVITCGKPAGSSQTGGTYFSCQRKDTRAALIGLIHITLFLHHLTYIALYIFMDIGCFFNKSFRTPLQYCFVLGMKMPGVSGMLKLQAATGMARHQRIAVKNLYILTTVRQFQFLPDVGMRYAVIMNVFAKADISILTHSSHGMFLDLV